MSSFTSFGGGGSPVNIDTSYELCGNDGVAAGAGTQVSSGLNAKGSWVQLSSTGAGGATVSAFAGFEVNLAVVASASGRLLVDIGVGDGTTGAGTTVIVPDIWVAPGTANTGKRFPFPLNVAAGSKIWVRTSSTALNVTLQARLRGTVRTASTPPLYNYCESIVPPSALTNTVPNTVDVLYSTTINTGWVTFKSSTAREYGALVTNLGLRSSFATPVNNQPASLRLGLGGSGATDAVWFHSSDTSSSVTVSQLFCFSEVVDKTIPVSSRLAVEILAAATDTAAPQVWGLYN